MQDLKGTPNQVEWATQLRVAFFGQFDRSLKQTIADTPEWQRPLMAELLSAWRATFEAQLDAAFWIRLRHEDFGVRNFRTQFQESLTNDPELKARAIEITTRAQIEKDRRGD
ncbi:MAG: hypothetical protein K1Y36_29635 [Blastocatellia bacterium]|nr:hypothetical protein [Blastocatellia bacterium]